MTTEEKITEHLCYITGILEGLSEVIHDTNKKVDNLYGLLGRCEGHPNSSDPESPVITED